MKKQLLATTLILFVSYAPDAFPQAQADAGAESLQTPVSGAVPDASAYPRVHRRHRHRHAHAAIAALPVMTVKGGASSDEVISPAAEMAQPAPSNEAPRVRPAMASVIVPENSPEQAGVGEGLTPTGAMAKGNAEGTIPAWTGGLVGPHSDQPVRYRPDPFSAERPLFRITAQNVDRYADKLAAGTVALIRTMPGYFIDVYPSHRTFAAPQFIYDNAIANAARAKLVHDGEGVEGASLSIPFPIPHNGAEAVWNHLLRYRGTQIIRTIDNIVSTPTGDYSIQKWQEELLFPYNTPGFQNPRRLDNLFRQEILSPPRDAGALTLVVNNTDPYDHDREAWSYNPGERRVRRAPDINYDTPLPDTDGLETVDDYDLFNGPLDRFTWTLVGRREVYVPYNTYQLQNPTLRYADLVGRDSLKPQYIRFELHRVWEVEGKVKPEFRHIYSRRTMYMDEDSWQCLIADRYDNRNQLWRTSMAFPVQATEVPLFGADGYEHIDLYQHRYLVQGLHGEEAKAPVYDATTLSLSDFTADALRRLGHR